MKKKIFAFSVALSVLMLAIVLISSTFQSKAENPSVTTNVKALTKVAFGECTGPKNSSHCQSQNTAPCSDLSGCDSKPIKTFD